MAENILALQLHPLASGFSTEGKFHQPAFQFSPHSFFIFHPRFFTREIRVKSFASARARKYASHGVHNYAVLSSFATYIFVFCINERINTLNIRETGTLAAKIPRHLEKIPRHPKILGCLGIFTGCLGRRKSRRKIQKATLSVSISRLAFVKIFYPGWRLKGGMIAVRW